MLRSVKLFPLLPVNAAAMKREQVGSISGAFAAGLMQAIEAKQDEAANLVFSPFSVFLALSMTMAGNSAALH